MWRKLPPIAPARHAMSFSRRLLCSVSLPRRAPQVPTSAAVEDNFVDIDSLFGFDAVVKPITTISSSSSSQPRATSPLSSSPDVLGVIRHIPEEDGQRYSRLQVPLSAKETAAPPRSNTRASLPLGEEANYADMSKIGASEDKEQPGLEAAASCEAAAETEDARLPDPTRLPYDDERFAEMLLEMEVNGVIDESWQDAHKARLEDVKAVADILAALKVRDVCCIDVSEKTSNFDYMMFGTCEGARHIHLAAWAVQDADKVHRVSKVKRKQTDELWEVVPVGRIVVNLMVESFREEMTLERKWAVTRTMDPLAAANAPISEGRQVKAHGLWTLTLNLQDLEDFEVDYCKDILMRQM